MRLKRNTSAHRTDEKLDRGAHGLAQSIAEALARTARTEPLSSFRGLPEPQPVGCARVGTGSG